MVILESVWFWRHGSCDVISPDHFVRGFYYSSFRRCGLNFLVLQKDNKILVHNLSIHEKLEQSTNWNLFKKWGKDFTFGSGCTVQVRSGWFYFVPLDLTKTGKIQVETSSFQKRKLCWCLWRKNYDMTAQQEKPCPVFLPFAEQN